MMGFIPAKGESVVVLLCRTCLGIGALKELGINTSTVLLALMIFEGWNMETWTPLIQDRELVPWLVYSSSPEQYKKKARPVTTAQVI